MSAVDVEEFGRTSRGERACLFTLEGDGIRARLTNFGATLVSLEVADRKGSWTDVVLGFDTLAEYESPQNPWCGGIVGRVANRIAGAQFELGGRMFALDANEGRHCLHGGARGFDRVVWDAHVAEGGVTFRRHSLDGEGGFPGNLDVSVWYALVKDRERSLAIVYDFVSDAPTPVNLTQHSYFNLADGDTIRDHLLEVNARRYVVVDAELIPTGELRDVEDSVFDFRRPRRIGAQEAGYDVCFALDGYWNSKPSFACRLTEPVSGRWLEISAMQPGLQLYTGQHLRSLRGKRGRPIPAFGGVCLEAQHYPDSVHRPEFPSTILRPGDPHHRIMLWSFGETRG